MNCPDYNDLIDIHEAEEERAYKKWLDRLPRCSECGKKIKDDNCYNIGGELFCEECIENSKVHTENYMED
jgi:formylmethanofuran dehydrogenase subunit E